jgi:hypothetical protein
MLQEDAVQSRWGKAKQSCTLTFMFKSSSLILIMGKAWWALIPKLSAPAPRVRFDTRNKVLTLWRHQPIVIPLHSH